MSKTFAIDYDATWTADPEAFAAIARMLRARGHRVILVTARVSGHGEVQREAGPHVDPPVMEWGRLCSRVRPGSSAVARDLVMRGWVFGVAYESEDEWILPMARPWDGEH